MRMTLARVMTHFLLQQVIGNGCFGKVMMVKCKRNERIFAMKTIRKAHVVKNNKALPLHPSHSLAHCNT